MEKLNQHLKKQYQINFNQFDHLKEAFTHASYVNEHPKENLKYYERIEFLGDAVMQLCVSEYLYKKYPNYPEGKLSKLRAAMVCEDSFSQFAKECGFDQYILLGKGEEKANARNRPGLLCDIFEAFIGALYLDQGKPAVEKFVNQVVFPKLDQGRFDNYLDYKSELQEYVQQSGPCEIKYKKVSETGLDNDKTYVMRVEINGENFGDASGRSKKAAEQKAAQHALKELQKKQGA